jgi:hypothetical protein
MNNTQNSKKEEEKKPGGITAQDAAKAAGVRKGLVATENGMTCYELFFNREFRDEYNNVNRSRF